MIGSDNRFAQGHRFEERNRCCLPLACQHINLTGCHSVKDVCVPHRTHESEIPGHIGVICKAETLLIEIFPDHHKLMIRHLLRKVHEKDWVLDLAYPSDVKDKLIHMILCEESASVRPFRDIRINPILNDMGGNPVFVLQVFL